MRILVTGSRDWQSRYTVYKLLWLQLMGLPVGQTLTVVHGDCPTGADLFAREWSQFRAKDRRPVIEERYPADWDQFGKSAGFRRNAVMVNLGADLCLAFIRNNSKGATGTLELAVKAGIKPIVERER